MKKNLILSALTCSLLLGFTTLQAKTDKKVLIQHEAQQHVKNQKEAPKEIIEGLQNTFMALTSLHKNDTKNVKALLEKASKNFDTALKANPSLALIPVDEELQAYTFMGSSDTIAARLELAQQLLKAHDTQVATASMIPLKDELTITTVYIPMKVYPLATKKALENFNKGDKDAAIHDLTDAMNSLVRTTVIMPTPLLVTEDLIKEASKLDKTKKAEASALLKAAKEELKRAELLGYTKKHEENYKLLNSEIEKIEKEIKGKNEIEKLYDTMKKDLTKIIENIRITKVKTADFSHNEAAQKVEAYEVKETNKAMAETDTFKKEAQEDEKKTINK